MSDGEPRIVKGEDGGLYVKVGEESERGGSAIAGLLVFLVLPIAIIVGNYTYAWKLPFLPSFEVSEVVQEQPPAPPPPPGPVQVSPATREGETIWKFLRANGLTPEQTAGVMGNLQAESGFKPGIEERGSGIGYGIAQWSFDRRVALEAAARRQKVPVSDLTFQLNYLYHEMHIRKTNLPEYKRWGNEWEMIKNQPNRVEALVAFHHEFERSKIMNLPNPRQAVINQRLKFADESMAKYSHLG